MNKDEKLIMNDYKPGSLQAEAFKQYIVQFGEEAFQERLEQNIKENISYAGDSIKSQGQVMELIQFGNNNPYQECPIFETTHFKIRLVRHEDTKDLICCYGDPRSQKLFNMDNCPQEQFDYVQRLPELIRGWLEHDYKNGYFIRFSIIDKQLKKAVGTIEVYDRKYQQTDRTKGILRIDLASKYEKVDYICEILEVSSTIFFEIFHSEIILHKAVPEAKQRIAALKKCGYSKREEIEYPHYWQLTR